MTPSRGGRDIVALSLEAWDDVWRRNQYFAAGLLRDEPDVRMLFVEPPADPMHAMASRAFPRPGAGLRAAPPIDGVGPNRCFLFQPTKFLPRRLDPRSDRRRARSIVHAIRRVDFARPLLWFNDVTCAPLIDMLALPSVYDVTDDWIAAQRPADEISRLTRDENLLLRRCNEVTVCSPALAAAKGGNRAVTLITNGVDVDRYRLPQPRPVDLPAGAVAVYVGTLHSDRLDIELCIRTAAALRGAGSVVLVGPNALTPAETDRLEAAGVILLGSRPYTAVPGYLQHAGVLLVPHVVDRFTDSLDPIKLYEYRCVGRPVVSTPVAGFRDVFDPGIVVATDEAFIDAVTRTVRTPIEATTDTPADLPTWRSQVARFGAVIARAISDGPVAAG